jgi:basic membrane protein A and related proteins
MGVLGTVKRFGRTLLVGAAVAVWGFAAQAADVKVALVLPGSINDGGWNQGAYTGLQALGKKAGFKVAFTENVKQADMPQVVRGYADDGYDLVIGHGFEFGSLFAEVAPEYAKQKFFATTFAPGPTVPANAMYLDFRYYDVAYAAGVLASGITKKKVIGFVGGGDNPTTQGILKVFRAAVEKTVPGSKVLGIITGDYDDAAKGREAAETMIGNGADLIWHAADITGIGAIKAAAAKGVVSMGTFADQTDIAPALVATSFVTDNAGLVVKAAEMVAAGTFKGGSEWKPSLKDVWITSAGSKEYNETLVPKAVWDAYTKTLADIEAGKIDTAALVK